MAISKRLLEIAKYIKGYETLADIACDHGYLGIYAAINFNLKEVLLTDINEMPLASAKENVAKRELNSVIKTKLGDGLAPLDKDYDVITIAGIGGVLLVQILENDLDKAKRAKRLVLCSNTDTDLVRKYLVENGFMIEREEMIHDYKYYEIIVAKYIGQVVNYTDLEIKYGPVLLKEKSKEFCEYYERQLKLYSGQVDKINDLVSKERLQTKISEINKILE